MIKFLVQLKWNFIFLIYTDDEYGERTKDKFTERAREKEICAHLEQTLTVKYATTAEIKASARYIINKVYRRISNGYHKSMVIVYLGYGEGFKHLLDAVKNADKPAGSKISWLFSRAVGTDSREVNMDYFQQTYGLAVTQNNFVHSDFNDYLNDVLQDKIDTHFNDLKSEYLSAINCDSSTIPTCHILKQNNSHFISNFIDSVLVSMTMLNDFHNRTCTKQGLCNQMKESLANKWWLSSVPAGINFRTTLNDSYLPKAYQSIDRNLYFTIDGQLEVNEESPLEIYRLPDPLDTVGLSSFSHLLLKVFEKFFPNMLINVCR